MKKLSLTEVYNKVINEDLPTNKAKPGVVDSMKLREARGTRFDYIRIKGAEPEKP